MRRPLSALLVLALSLVAVPAFAAYDAYLKIDGVSGESTDASHKDWISVASFNLTLGRSGAATGTGTAARTVAAERGNLTVTKRLDKASPKLYEASAQGKHFPLVVLEFSKEKEHVILWRLTMQDVLVAAVRKTSNPTDPVPTESLELTYGKIEWEYRPQSADGKVGEWVKRDVSELEKGLPQTVVRMRATEIQRR